MIVHWLSIYKSFNETCPKIFLYEFGLPKRLNGTSRSFLYFYIYIFWCNTHFDVYRSSNKIMISHKDLSWRVLTIDHQTSECQNKTIRNSVSKKLFSLPYFCGSTAIYFALTKRFRQLRNIRQLVSSEKKIHLNLFRVVDYWKKWEKFFFLILLYRSQNFFLMICLLDDLFSCRITKSFFCVSVQE